jgi:hypothetical protein
MVFADIVGFLNTGTLEEMMKMQLSQSLLLVFSLLLEIPIIMIFLSFSLPSHKANRIANITAVIITTIWIIGGGNTSLSYIFFVTIELFCMVLIVLCVRSLGKSEV